MNQNLPEDMFRRCVEDSSDAIMLTDQNGHLVYVNRSWCVLYGYSQGEAIGQKASLLHSGVHDDQFYQDMWKDILSLEKGYWSGEVINRAKDASLRTVLLTITPYRRSFRQGPVEGFMGIAVDRTAVKEMEKRLAQQDKLVLLGTLASALAHEIGTPLGVIRGRAEMMLEQVNSLNRDALLASLTKSASSICDQVDRVSKVMTRILGFARSRVQNFSDSIAEPKKSLVTFFEDVEALVDSHFRRTGVELEIIHPGGNLFVMSASSLEQILINLLLNGVRAVEQSESAVQRRVFLELRSMSPDEDPEADSGWCFAIEDTGLGVPPELRSRIFEPFFTTDLSKGTGLGLAISSKIAIDLGGSLSLAESKRSETGARFVLALPRRAIEDSGLRF